MSYFLAGMFTMFGMWICACCGVKALKLGQHYWAAMHFSSALAVAIGMGVSIGSWLAQQ